MVIAYMLTWTTYGTWLQGDRRGWVKDSKICYLNSALEDTNRKQMKAKTTTLTKEQRTLVRQTIIDEAKELGQKLFALAVCSNHVHLIVQNTNLSIGRVVSHYKNASRLILQEHGFEGKLWTQGFDKRYCMNTQELDAKITYVCKHKN